jgi:hypothetical protein
MPAEPPGHLASLLAEDRLDGESVGLFFRREGEERFPGQKREDDRKESRGLLVPETAYLFSAMSNPSQVVSVLT